MLSSGKSGSKSPVSQEHARPLRNLVRAVKIAVSPSSDMLEKLDRIVAELKTDKDGNIDIGLDGRQFAIWDKIKPIIPFKIFGPVLIATNPNVIKAILMKLKNAPEGFAGNASSDHIARLAGTENIFAANNHETHSEHKRNFKQHLADYDRNISWIGNIVHSWLEKRIAAHGVINDHELEILCAKVMVRFLLGENHVNIDESLAHAINLKKHFINKATLQQTNKHSYRTSRDYIDKAIEDLFNTPGSSFPSFLAGKGYELNVVQSEIRSLLMVGFDNLRGALSGMLTVYAQHPEIAAKLKSELMTVHDLPFLKFDTNQNEYSRAFFLESTSEFPPVWMQARKNGEEDLTIEYRNDDNTKSQFTIKSRTLILIPLIALARQLKAGDNVNFERDGVLPLSLPFSTGLNACPGFPIGYATAGLLFGGLVMRDMTLQQLSEPVLSPKVSLTIQGLDLRIVQDIPEQALAPGMSIIKPNTSQQTSGLQAAQARFWQTTEIIKSGVTLTNFGVATFLTYYATEDMLLSLGAGVLTGLSSYILLDDELKRSFSGIKFN